MKFTMIDGVCMALVVADSQTAVPHTATLQHVKEAPADFSAFVSELTKKTKLSELPQFVQDAAKVAADVVAENKRAAKARDDAAKKAHEAKVAKSKPKAPAKKPAKKKK